MKLYLVKPDLTYFDDYNKMMKEWIESNTQISPWFLDKPFSTIEEFAKFIKYLDDCSHGRLDTKFSTTTSYFVVDDNNKLIGAASLRHYLTIEGLNKYGHVGYGIRPTERLKGYATQTLIMLLDEAKKKGIQRIYAGANKNNIASCKTIEKCGFKYKDTINDIDDNTKFIKRYEIYYK